ncbi:MAG: TonB-dependent receptor [Gammaproteobacteria bacterium]|nr:TonB-dependent receptor [Gammaproteobacteria bacterium]
MTDFASSIGKTCCAALTSLCIFATAAVSPSSANSRPDPMGLTELSLEELLNIEVTSVSKKSQSLSEAAAAVFVITQDDIRRSGATNIPEALRMAPGVQVARLDSNKWAVSVRGFNGYFANKLLVLMDGRTLYTPSFSGVLWEKQDTVMEDIERIEVIRGPGATLWGANAVNGVINIITKSAKDTQGLLLSIGGGTEERAFGTLRYGGTFADGQSHYRVYGKYFDRDGSIDQAGNDNDDEWQMGRGGFRLDWNATDDDSVILVGNIFDGDGNEIVNRKSLTPPHNSSVASAQDMDGGDLLTRWERNLEEGSELSLQLYYDHSEKNTFIYEFKQDIIDVDFQHRFPLVERHDIIWGLGYRFYSDKLNETLTAQFNPERRDLNFYSGFIQDDISLIPEQLRLTLGSKVEHNDLSGFEIQPNIRLLWLPDKHSSLWASVSRAVRTPSRVEQDLVLVQDITGVGEPLNPFPVPIVTMLNGNRDFDSEELLAYEIGYRLQLNPQFGIDTTVFYNEYDKLRSPRLGSPQCSPAGTFPGCFPPLSNSVITPLNLTNEMKGDTHGLEIVGDWRVSPMWHLQAAYTYLKMDLETHNDDPLGVEFVEGQSPNHQASLRSSTDLAHNIELGLWLRYVDRLSNLAINSYVTLDTRLAWWPQEDLELSVIGQNLFDSQHPEFTSEISNIPPLEIQRSVYAQLRWMH